MVSWKWREKTYAQYFGNLFNWKKNSRSSSLRIGYKNKSFTGYNTDPQRHKTSMYAPALFFSWESWSYKLSGRNIHAHVKYNYWWLDHDYGQLLVITLAEMGIQSSA